MSTGLGLGVLGEGILAGDIAAAADGLEVTILLPMETVSTQKPTVTWSHTPGTSIQTEYIVSVDQGVTNVYTSGWQTSADQSHQIPDALSAGAQYTVRVNIKTDYPSTGFDVASFKVETPDLIDSVSEPYLLHEASLL